MLSRAVSGPEKWGDQSLGAGLSAQEQAAKIREALDAMEGTTDADRSKVPDPNEDP